MQIDTIFGWLGDAAVGGLDVLSAIANGVSKLFFVITETGEFDGLTLIGALVIASVGAPLAWKFIKYIISLFKKVQPN